MGVSESKWVNSISNTIGVNLLSLWGLQIITVKQISKTTAVDKAKKLLFLNQKNKKIFFTRKISTILNIQISDYL